MSCTRECRKPAPSQAHCATCHRTFGAVGGFDRHRRHGECLDPTTLGMVDRGGGVWRTPMSDEYRERLAAIGGTP